MVINVHATLSSLVSGWYDLTVCYFISKKPTQPIVHLATMTGENVAISALKET